MIWCLCLQLLKVYLVYKCFLKRDIYYTENYAWMSDEIE